jgi:hypothetical protein
MTYGRQIGICWRALEKNLVESQGPSTVELPTFEIWTKGHFKGLAPSLGPQPKTPWPVLRIV